MTDLPSLIDAEVVKLQEHWEKLDATSTALMKASSPDFDKIGRFFDEWARKLGKVTAAGVSWKSHPPVLNLERKTIEKSYFLHVGEREPFTLEYKRSLDRGISRQGGWTSDVEYLLQDAVASIGQFFMKRS